MNRRSVLDRASAGVRVNVVPMIDVVMCLIVFYLMVGQLALDRAAGIEIPDTPQGAPAREPAGDPAVIGVRADGSLLLNGDPIEPARLTGELAGRLARNNQTRVEVRADESAAYAVVRPVLDAARAAGATEIELVTDIARPRTP